MKKILPIIIVALMLVGCLFACVACNKPYVADNTEFYDDITKKLKLDTPYNEESKLMVDGISIVTVSSYTDGDTTTFNLPADGGSVRVRYYGVDTPESTISVEKWGKAASNFTHDKLAGADLILLESNVSGQKPDTDTTSSQRSLCYVWYRTKGTSDIKCLNLELVENGFSLNKLPASSARYGVFNSAEAFAKKIKLRWHSALDDPLYSDDAVAFSIKDFLADPSSYDTSGSTKVTFEAYLTKLSVTTTYTFVATQYDEETDKEYSIDVYAGYSNKSGSSMKLGHYYQIVGRLQEGSGGYQITDIDYVRSEKYQDADTTHVQQSNYYLTFDPNTPATYTSHYADCFYGRFNVTEVVDFDEATRVLTFTGMAKKNIDGSFSGDFVEFTVTVKVPAGTDYATDIKAGASLKFTALQFVQDSGNLYIVDYTSIV